MNKAILTPEVQSWIQTNIQADIRVLALKGSPFEDVSIKELLEQLEAKQKAEKKLPTWFAANNLYFPKPLSIEQTSSEQTASYKANLVQGNVIDITGGFGVDAYFFSKKAKHVIHVECQKELTEIVSYNFKKLKIANITCELANGIDYVLKNKNTYDVIYIDPARRNEEKGKVFFLKDCEPNIVPLLNDLFKKASHILVKTSPMLDITQGLRELKNVKEIHVVSLNNEMKEVLWLLEKEYTNEIVCKVVNIGKLKVDIEAFVWGENLGNTIEIAFPQKYIYQPNAAILKAGAGDYVSMKLGLKKLGDNTQLYTTNEEIDFPGKCFKVLEVNAFNKKEIKKRFFKTKANVISKNFPLSVKEIKQQFQIMDGGEVFLFFVTSKAEKFYIIAEKVT